MRHIYEEDKDTDDPCTAFVFVPVYLLSPDQRRAVVRRDLKNALYNAAGDNLTFDRNTIELMVTMLEDAI